MSRAGSSPAAGCRLQRASTGVSITNNRSTARASAVEQERSGCRDAPGSKVLPVPCCRLCSHRDAADVASIAGVCMPDGGPVPLPAAEGSILTVPTVAVLTAQGVGSRRHAAGRWGRFL